MEPAPDRRDEWHESVGGVRRRSAGRRVARARLRNWGATRAEIEASHAGDDVVAGPVTTSTYAVTVEAPADIVWSWLVQIGQGRGDMYSYEWLENLFGLDIDNTNQTARTGSTSPSVTRYG